MITFLKTLAALAVMVSIIPLAVWAGSGSWRQALEALRGYLTAMSLIVGIPAALAGVTVLIEFLT